MSARVLSLTATVGPGLDAYVHAPAEGDRLPVVVLVHGSHTHPRHYSRYAAALAAEGYVVVAPEQVREVFGSTAHYPQQAFVDWGLAWAVTEHERDGSPLRGRLDTGTLLVAGHSMGGGAVLGVVSGTAQVGLADDPWSRPPQLAGAVVHGTHNIPPPRTGDPLPVDAAVPVAFVQGTADGVVTPDQARRTFDAVSGALPRLLVEVEGANHFLLTDSSSPEGANTDPCPATIGQDAAIAAAARWTAVWFRACTGDADALATLRRGAEESYVALRLVEA